MLLFAILAIVSGCNSYRGIVTCFDVHQHRLHATFGLTRRRALAHTAIRRILKGLDPAAVEPVFRRHAAQVQAVCGKPGQGGIAVDGKTLRGSFDRSHDSGRNRDESRIGTVFDPAGKLAGTGWHSNVAAIIQVERRGFPATPELGC